MADSHAHSHPTPKDLILNAGLLAILMSLTIWVYVADIGHVIAHAVNKGPSADALGSYLNNAIAISIALFKGYRVVNVFMGVKYSTPLTKLWAWAGFVWFPLMLIIFGDYTSRHWETPQGWTTNATDTAPLRSQLDPEFARINKEKGYKKGHGGEKKEEGGH